MSTTMKGTIITGQPGMSRRGTQGFQVSTHSPPSIRILSTPNLNMQTSSIKTKSTQIRNILMLSMLLTMPDLKEEEAAEEVRALSLTTTVTMPHLLFPEEEDKEAEVVEEVHLISITMRTIRKHQSIDTTMTIMKSTQKHTVLNMTNIKSMIKLRKNLQLKNMRRLRPKKSQYMIMSKLVLVRGEEVEARRSEVEVLR